MKKKKNKSLLVLLSFSLFFIFHSVDPPEIIKGPESQSVATGAAATFGVEATGDDIEFQWQKDKINIDDKNSRFSLKRTDGTSVLNIQYMQKSDKGQYRCLVKNPVEKSGKPSQEANLAVGKFVL